MLGGRGFWDLGACVGVRFFGLWAGLGAEVAVGFLGLVTGVGADGVLSGLSNCCLQSFAGYLGLALDSRV